MMVTKTIFRRIIVRNDDREYVVTTIDVTALYVYDESHTASAK